MGRQVGREDVIREPTPAQTLSAINVPQSLEVLLLDKKIEGLC